LNLDEARVVVGRILALIPQSISGNAELYIDGLAHVLMRYPRLAVRNAADSFSGVARELKYGLPKPADVIDWCEKEVAWLRRIADREALTRRQLTQQAPPEPSPEERARVTIGFRRLVDHLGERTKEQVRQERKVTLAFRTDTDSRLFERECVKAGLDPVTTTATPYLQELIRQQEAKRLGLGPTRQEAAAAAPENDATETVPF
jgi:hypothetical protein